MSATSDSAARTDAVNPGRNVVLEASAGTGKTRVLVERYVNLLRAGVDADHILAITFTRKAAAEMRDRIIDRLREANRQSEFTPARWRELKERFGEISISTIDAFCLSLLREFPLEADVDPAFDLADDTEAPRLVAESLDQALRICRGLARTDEDVDLVFAQLGERRLRSGLTLLLARRLVAPQALQSFLGKGPRDLTAAVVCRRAAARIRDAATAASGGLEFLADGPVARPQFAMMADDIRRLVSDGDLLTFDAREDQAAFRVLIDRLRAYFLTQEGQPRGERFAGTGFTAADCRSEAAWKRHRTAAAGVAPGVSDAIRAFRRDLNAVLSRGVWRIFSIALRHYEQTLDERALLDFSGVLERAIKLLKEMDEFAQSRFRLETRYRHVLVDEFQDTSRAQWDLVAQLVRSWGEGLGAASDSLPPSIFIVGDRKQSIYGFRDAEVAVLDEAAKFVRALRPDDDPHRAITVSYRALPALLAFVNDVFAAVEKMPDRADAFRYSETDRFPNIEHPAEPHEASLGIAAAPSITESADLVGAEIGRLLGHFVVRDRTTGVRRPARASDVAILFRSRDSHREFEKALERRGISTYVYKGLGFFDADEVQDVVALLRYLADPTSSLRAATFLRSRVVRLSDRAISQLAPDLAGALLRPDTPEKATMFDEDDQRVFARLRLVIPQWLRWVDRLPPADLMDRLLADTAYFSELDGPRFAQGRENLKKLGAMVRKFQNRGYATLARLTEHLEELAVGDESNASIDAQDAVSLMTVHAAKGLEFPIVFVVNVNRGTGNWRDPIRVSGNVEGAASVAVADYQSEADDDAAARDREETKRLLYVALTRARDRLYLAASVTDGGFRATRGSLGEVLPASVRDLFVRAAAGGADVVTWAGESGQLHELAVAGPQAPRSG